ncbi:hypothetical protein Ddye_007440 [Dipteronia dyeriana]|uniref:MATH domain-containing protein n=1 Tax=Dipteronia dyeriana TaxID=168575 RepID=A0AAD9XK89_9ROSI|nr:hypothetical protein Ddye_007440 [Dipteronia dyeriana]
MRVRHYNELKLEWGIPKFIDIKTFVDQQNGYLFNDKCVFGAEVFVHKIELLSVMDQPIIYPHTWVITKFSSLHKEYYESEPFGLYKWKILLYPKGYGAAKGSYISLFISQDESNIHSSKKFGKIILRVQDQITGKHIEVTGENNRD